MTEKFNERESPFEGDEKAVAAEMQRHLMDALMKCDRPLMKGFVLIGIFGVEEKGKVETRMYSSVSKEHHTVLKHAMQQGVDKMKGPGRDTPRKRRWGRKG